MIEVILQPHLYYNHLHCLYRIKDHKPGQYNGNLHYLNRQDNNNNL